MAPEKLLSLCGTEGQELTLAGRGQRHMRGPSTFLPGFPWGSEYPGSEARAPAEYAGNPEFGLHSPADPRRGPDREWDAPGEVFQEGLAGLTRGASRVLTAPPCPPDSVSASSLLPISAPVVFSSSPHLVAGDGWSRATPQR